MRDNTAVSPAPRRRFKRLPQLLSHAGTGLTVTAVAVAGVLAAGFFQPPYPTVTATPTTVDVASAATHTVACTGALSQLGLDVDNPSLAVPLGKLQLLHFGGEAVTLQREAGAAESFGVAFQGAATQPFAAAGWQTVQTEQAAGFAAVNCTAPLTEQWLVAGKTVLGSTVTLALANPGTKTATVQVEAFNAAGQVQFGNSTGAVVPPGQVRTIAVNGIAPEAAELALRVISHGSAVTAQLGITEMHDIRTFGADLVAAQHAPTTELVFPGLRSANNLQGSDANNATLNELLLFAPHGGGTATVLALTKDGAQTVQEITLTAGAVSRTELLEWPAGAALLVRSTTPVVGGASGSTLTAGKTDMVWFTPAAPLTQAAGVVVPGGELHLVNPAASPVTVALTAATGETQTVELPAQSQHTVAAAPEQLQLTVTGPVHAGVTIFNNDGAAAYPLTAAQPPQTQLLLYTD